MAARQRQSCQAVWLVTAAPNLPPGHVLARPASVCSIVTVDPGLCISAGSRSFRRPPRLSLDPPTPATSLVVDVEPTGQWVRAGLTARPGGASGSRRTRPVGP